MVYTVFASAAKEVVDQIEFFIILDKLCHFTMFRMNLEGALNLNNRIRFHLDIWKGKEPVITTESIPEHELNRYTLKDITLLLKTYPDYPRFSTKMTKPKELKTVYQAVLKDNNIKIEDSIRTHKMIISAGIFFKDVNILLQNQMLPYGFEVPNDFEFTDAFGNITEYTFQECCTDNLAIKPIGNCLCHQHGFIGALKYKFKFKCSVVKTTVYSWENGKASMINAE